GDRPRGPPADRVSRERRCEGGDRRLRRQAQARVQGTLGMDRNIFEEEHEIFRDSVARFMQAEVTPNLERWLEAGIIERELFRKAGEQGYCLMWADEAYGGMGIRDFRFEQILIEENAFHGDAGFGLSLHSRLC